MAKIYISSTFSDLKDCRKAVYDALRALRHDVIAMEDYVAADQRPLDKCLSDVEDSDLYLGIFAWRYGYVPGKDNPEQRSITELEFRHAVSKSKPCFIFLLAEDASWPYQMIEQGEGSERLKLLREELGRDYLASFFKTREELARFASTAVANWQNQNRASSSGEADPPHSTRVNITRLPITGRDLFGRERELQQLDEAWASQTTNVLSLVAWGGVGKSALFNKWLARIAQNDYRGARRVYGWSFYSQGTTDRAASADQFIEAALVWFGDTDPNRGSPWDKGERLAHLIGEQRALLVLDGLEPLQHPPGPDEGRLKDQALQSLLRQLAANNKGLCIISTRVPVADLSPFEGHTATRINLENLSPATGAQVLHAQGVKGPQAELEQASTEFDGHSLALTLLGSYLNDVHDGDIARRVEVKGLEEDERHGRHAQKVMISYEKWFGEGPELSVLNILGLFNRPADKKAVDALRATPAIKGLTDKLRRLSEHKWQQLLSKLRRAKLLAEKDPNQPETLDAHPLVREHFGRKLKQERPAAWKGANYRLYKHYKKTAKVFPDTIEEMAPLYAAITHGCEAGEHQEVLEKIYYQRISRGYDFFSKNQLGAYGADLAALINFYSPDWKTPVAGITKSFKGFLLNDTAWTLQALGRLMEAAPLEEAAVNIAISRSDWGNVSLGFINLSEIYLTLGYLDQALNSVNRALEFAPDQSRRKAALSMIANVLYQSGHSQKAESVLQEVEAIKDEPLAKEPSLIYTLTDFYYGELLLDQGKYVEVQMRATKTLDRAVLQNWLLDIALSYLCLGRAHLLRVRQEANSDFSQTITYLKRAVDGLRQSGDLTALPSGLLARAELHRVNSKFDQAQADLDEAMGIATRGSMRLHEANCHLEYARLYLAQGEKEKARESWAKAKEMIERMGYHRRDKDVREIEDLLTGATGEGES